MTHLQTVLDLSNHFCGINLNSTQMASTISFYVLVALSSCIYFGFSYKRNNEGLS